jgi:hypothetical protein
MRLSQPALRRLVAGDHAETGVFRGEPREDPGRRVHGPIVHDDDLEVGIVLRQVRPDGGLDAEGFVARGDDDGDARERFARPALLARETRHRRGVDGEEEKSDDREAGGADEGGVEKR